MNRPQVHSAGMEASDADIAVLVRRSSLPVFLVQLDDRRILEVSDQFAAMYGVARDQLLGRDGTELAVDSGKARSRLGLLASGELDSYRVHGRAHRRHDGSEFVVDTCLQAVTGSVPRRLAVGVFLPPGEPSWTSCGDHTNPPTSALGTVADDLSIDRISADIEQIIGRSAASVVGQPFSTLIEDSDWPSLLIAIGHGLHSGGGSTSRVHLRLVDGKKRVARMLITPLAPDSSTFAFALTLLSEPADAIAARAWELEGHLRRIAGEVAASGVLSSLTAVPTAAEVPAMAGLTSRELEIVTRILAGDRVPMIAQRMFLSQSTIRNHLTAVYRKLGVRSQQDLISLLRSNR
jgi:PAS domain S-box-containing protein